MQTRYSKMCAAQRIDPEKICQIYSGSTELSPFHKCYETEHTVLRVCAGRFFAHYNGDDPVAAYWALRQKAVLYDVPERPLEVSGPDALHFLEMIFSRKISNLKVGRGYYTIACTFGGGIFMDGILFRLAPDRYWFVQPDGRSGKILATVSAGRGTVRAETCRGHRTAKRRLERRSLCE